VNELFTRKRLVVVGVIALFIAAFAAIGAISKSSSNTIKTVTASPNGAKVPYASWYWTMLVSPTDANSLLVGTNQGVISSTNGGKTWKTSGLTNVNTTSLAQMGNAIYAAGVVGPNPVIHNTLGRTAPNGTDVFEVSSNGGKTWNVLHPSGLPKDDTVQAMDVDPSNSALYVLYNTGGLYRSTNAVKSFQLVTAKLGISPWAFAAIGANQFVSGDMDSGPHTSSNAKAWSSTAFTDPSGGHMVMEYAVQPSDPSNVLMTSIGVEQSTNGGKSWHPVLEDGTVMFGPVAYAPKSPQLAYAIGFGDRSVWKSTDGGKTWTQVL
jgi:photosystem II stability/assembly factor-like uncharacterized protein